MIENSPIKEFYENKSIFITGGTGFLGKVLIEKLLRTCNVKRIYLLMREKKGKAANERVEELINAKPFTFNLNPNVVFAKLVAVNGDIRQAELGLSKADKQTLIDNVEIVIHSAASVRFDEPLNESLANNVFGTRSILELCRQMPHLKCFVHVSTAYSNCNRKEIDEKLYPLSCNADELIANAKLGIEDEGANLEGHPNSYTYSKAIAEYFVKRERGQLPVCIVRPSIIINAQSEPVPGWIEGTNGPAGLTILAYCGILRCSNWNYWCNVDQVPVDKVANAIVAAGWKTATDTLPSDDLPVYNVTSSNVNPLSWGGLYEHYRRRFVETPPIRIVRPFIEVPVQKGPHPIFYPLNRYLNELLFAYFFDFVLGLLGFKQVMVTVTKKMHKAFDILQPFTINEWIWNSGRMLALSDTLTDDDKRCFNFDMSDINWEQFSYNAISADRLFLLRDDPSTIKAARIRYRTMEIAYSCMKLLLLLFVVLLTPLRSIIIGFFGKFFLFLSFSWRYYVFSIDDYSIANVSNMATFNTTF